MLCTPQNLPTSTASAPPSAAPTTAPTAAAQGPTVQEARETESQPAAVTDDTRVALRPTRVQPKRASAPSAQLCAMTYVCAPDACALHADPCLRARGTLLYPSFGSAFRPLTINCCAPCRAGAAESTMKGGGSTA